MLTLTVENYLLMEQRAEFDAWLEAEGLKDALIFKATFGEGYLDAYCYKRNERGDRYLACCTPEPVVAAERRIFRTSTPPPAFVYDYCR